MKLSYPELIDYKMRESNSKSSWADRVQVFTYEHKDFKLYLLNYTFLVGYNITVQTVKHVTGNYVLLLHKHSVNTGTIKR